MALANYTDLTTSIANWMNRTDLTAIIPDFVTLAEARMARDLRLRNMIVSSNVSTVGGTQSVAYPTDLLEIENLTITDTSPPAALSVVTPEIMDRKFPAGYWTGIPSVYCILGTNIQLGPTPAAVYTLQIDYYKRFDSLQSASTNWLMTNFPDIYLAACMLEANIYLMDDAKTQLWDQKYQAVRDLIQEKDDTLVRSGSAMRVRAL